MNKIVAVKCGQGGDTDNCKHLKVIVTGKGDELRVVQSGGELAVSGGQVAIIPPLVPHEIAGATRFTITLSIEQPLVALKGVAVIDDVDGGFRFAAEQSEKYFGEGGESVLNALGELIVAYIKSAVKAETSPVVAAVKEDVEKNAGDCAYSVETYLRKLPLNYDYVRKLFKKETGLTPHEYLTATRMERAGKIILSGVSNRYSAYTVGQIAEACGYAEPLYFSRVFKKYFGVSPTEYAKRR